MVAIGFCLLSVVMFCSMFYVLGQSVDRKRLIRNYVLYFAIWLGYIFVLSNTGLLDVFSLPPRVPLFIIVPSIIICIVVTGRPAFKEIMAKLPVTFAVYIQSFRILVELLIYGAFVKGIFPQAVTFEGTNFDILVGLSALVVGFLVQRHLIDKKGLLVWNIVSLCILTLTGYSFISSYYFYDMVNLEQALRFVRFPYLLLPSVLLPFAMFYHTLSIRQLMLKN